MTTNPSINQVLAQATTLGEKLLRSASKPLIVILGPTASGKTDFSLQYSKMLQKNLDRHAEIVNADSRQLYAWMDIGTAKITPEEMNGIPHHLLDVLHPQEEITAATYKRMAMTAIDAIHIRGNVPLLVGGSMLYISSVIDDLQFPSVSDPAIRQQLEEEYERDQGVALHKKLATLDPESAAGIQRQNKPYLIRALEIIQSTGKNVSSAQGRGACPYDLLVLGINRPREALMRRINQRTKHLLQSGWVDEVKALLKKGFTAEDPGMKSHGYREIIERVQKGDDQQLQTDADFAETISSQTRQYAKRQMTWWRQDERIQWLIID